MNPHGGVDSQALPERGVGIGGGAFGLPAAGHAEEE